jgi:hypothetical protein
MRGSKILYDTSVFHYRVTIINSVVAIAPD